MRPFLVPSRHAQRFFGDRLVFWIDPAALRLRLPDRVRVGTADIWLSDRFIDDGDWSGVLRPIEALAEHRDMLELVRFGEGYSEMPIFLELARRIRAGNPATRYGRVLNSEESLHDYFRYFLQLIDSIRDRGFQRQSLLPASRGEGVEVRGKWAARQRDIGVAIGADGSVVRFLGGRHRTAIAQAMSVPAVPVEIRLVHRDFLAAQARTRTVGPAEALLQWVGEQASARRP